MLRQADSAEKFVFTNWEFANVANEFTNITFDFVLRPPVGGKLFLIREPFVADTASNCIWHFGADVGRLIAFATIIPGSVVLVNKLIPPLGFFLDQLPKRLHIVASWFW